MSLEASPRNARSVSVLALNLFVSLCGLLVFFLFFFFLFFFVFFFLSCLFMLCYVFLSVCLLYFLLDGRGAFAHSRSFTCHGVWAHAQVATPAALQL